jgi:plasmid stabilization system protein ParE
MNLEIIWSDQARYDLQHIYNFIAEDSAYYAEIELIKLKTATEILIRHPYTGRVVPELENDEIRELIQGNYRIIYRLKGVFPLMACQVL